MPQLAEKTIDHKEGTTMTKGKKRWPIVVAAVLAVLAAAGIFAANASKQAMLTISPTDTAKLVRCDLQDSISTTGSVESAKSMTVYSTKAYTVQEILVEVGDRVEEGQLLCKLDDQTIRNQIESQQASLDASTNSSNAAIHSAQDTYLQFKASLENGTNSSLISAENAVTNAKNAYETAQETYARYLAGLNTGENTTVLAQENTLRTARNAVDNAYNTYYTAIETLEDTEEALEEAKDAVIDTEEALEDAQWEYEEAEDRLYEAERSLEETESQIGTLKQQIAACTDELEKLTLQAKLAEQEAQKADLNTDISSLEWEVILADAAVGTAESAVQQAETMVKQYENSCETAEKNIQTCLDAVENTEEAYRNTLQQYNAAMTSVDNMLADYAQNVESTRQAYETAQASLEAAKVSVQNQLKTYQNSLNSAYANVGKGTLEVSLRQLEAELEGTEITAPMAGTVTAVYAEVGSAGSGLLFIIEDTENFVITTSVKDYDIAAVSVGTAATIRSDATGEDLYEGEVTYLAPTATKNAMGVTDTSGDISFAADVKVNSKDTKLRIGLNVRLSLIVAEEKDTLAAPYDAIYTNAQGQDCLLIAEAQEDGLYLLREQPVELGLETDLDIAVKADSLTDGMVAVTNPEQHVSHVGQKIAIGSAARQGLLGGN